MRVGAFTPTEAAVMAVFYGLFVGFVVYRSMTLRDLYEMLVEAGEISAVILVIVALASVFAWSPRRSGSCSRSRGGSWASGSASTAPSRC
jgi:TRAP-type C4-dicarboxylate transport system permease large subunit